MPAVHVATSEFERAARANARMRGFPNLPILVLPHPLETRTDAELLQLAEERFPDLVRLLTDQNPPTDSNLATVRGNLP